VAADPTPKRILVLSDNDGLSRAIKSNVNGSPEVVRLASNLPGQQRAQAENGDFDLIVVAMSSPSSNPLIALSRISQMRQVKQVPILIISEKSFCPAPGDRIIHLDFPFEVDQFSALVQELLQEDSRVHCGNLPFAPQELVGWNMDAQQPLRVETL
jgi:CheY-like chemotaxis protein